MQSIGFSTDGFATTTAMRELRLIWVTSRMHIEIYKYPEWGDVVEIETWFQGEGRIGARRDWILRDLATGLAIGRATSKWVMMNQDTRKFQRASDEVEEEYLVFCPQTPRFAFPEEENDSLKKIAKLADPADYSRSGLVPRRADLDMNQHVNYATYIGWVLESMPQQIIDTHELQTITLDYRRECRHGDMFDSLTSSDSEGILLSKSSNDRPSNQLHNHGSGHLHFMHFLRLSGTSLEINRGRTIWRKLIRFAFPEEENDCLKKIAKLEDPADYSRLRLVPRRADLDMNQHVNNVTYIGWVLESMPQAIINPHELQNITFDYRRERQHDDMVDSPAQTRKKSYFQKAPMATPPTSVTAMGAVIFISCTS